jgi:dinuclear metal center YbgI/SA1388 family protein
MLIKEFDAWIRNTLGFEQVEAADNAMNGLQVSSAGKELKKIAFAVDACLESFKRAKALDADLIFVHHGIFWGDLPPLTGLVYERVKFLIEHNLSLYAVHLPLDMHPELGNNARLADLVGLEQREPFGPYHGIKIGIKGVLPQETHIKEIGDTLAKYTHTPPQILALGKEKIKTVCIVSGGAPESARDAIAQGIDLFFTGEASHTIYHECAEAPLNVIFAGHYLTEVWGVQAVQKKIAADTGLATCFIDIPTGY